MLLTQTEIASIKGLIAANQQPWKGGYDKLIVDANKWLAQAPLSVTYQGSTSHTFIDQNPYDWSNNMQNSPCGNWYCDGQKNPLADNADAQVLDTFRRAVIDLTMAYTFSGNRAYADKAIGLINTWCLNPATKMNPTIPPGTGGNTPQAAFVTFIHFPSVFYGASLIWNYDGWKAADRAAFASWSATLLVAGKSSGPYWNNWEAWRELFLATGGALLDDASLLTYTFNTWKSKLAGWVGADGSMTHEITRTKSLFYSMYALEPILLVAEIAQRRGTDLYNYSVNGRKLEMALDYIHSYVINPSTWPYQQISPFDYFGAGIFEIAYTQYRKASYQNVLNARPRPIKDWQVASVISLTHAFRGSTNTQIAPVSPSSLMVSN